MNSSLGGRSVFAAILVFAFGISDAAALPFSAETTTRESIPRFPYPTVTPVPGVTPLATPTPIPQQLYAPSGELSFQKLDDGRIFFAFASKDPAVDNYYDDLGVYHTGVCEGTSVKHVYWVNEASGEASRCLDVTYPDFIQAEDDASNPKIGGAGDETGRYVAFESESHNLIPPTPTLDPSVTPSPTPTGFSGLGYAQQIYIHDRKWERTGLSRSKYDWSKRACSGGHGPNDDNYLTRISRDGSKLLFSSKATNIIDNLEPPGTDPNGSIMDIFVRDGNDCEKNTYGVCKTSVLYDRYHFHADPALVGLVNGDSENADWTPDQSAIVFDTASTVPVGYLPDLLGYQDIFFYEGEVFDRISNEQLAVTDGNTGAVTLINAGGPANGNSRKPRVDASGKYVVFESAATNLVLEKNSSGEYVEKIQPPYEHNHIYLYNRYTEQVTLITKNSSGVPGDGVSENAWISDDARFIIFESRARNLVDGITTTAFRNIFVFDRTLEQFYLVTPGPNPSHPNADVRTTQGLTADARITDVDPDGLTIAFESEAANAINGSLSGVVPDTNGVQDAFIAFNACPEDNDSDGIPNCLDLCPTDHEKHEPGQCGCGTADTDTDADGTSDCIDECPNQAAKTSAGQCGCDAIDTDTDRDGKADCVDGCQYDPAKTAPGVCGCGISDADLNGNGIADCGDLQSGTTPAAPRVRVSKKAGRAARVKVTGQAGYSGVVYTFTVKNSRTKAVTTKRSRNGYVVLRNVKAGRYSVRYQIKQGSTVSKWSTWKNYKV